MLPFAIPCIIPSFKHPLNKIEGPTVRTCSLPRSSVRHAWQETYEKEVLLLFKQTKKQQQEPTLWQIAWNVSFIRPISTRDIPCVTSTVILSCPLGTPLKVSVMMCQGAGNL